MLLLFIVVPCIMVAVVLVAALERGGLLSGLEPRPRPASPEVGFVLRRAVKISGMAIMGAWILAWIVALAVGLRIILGSG